ncbi:MAG: T9SS type A sorting domain-containing protein [Terrimicrobiaceae bacterium]
MKLSTFFLATVLLFSAIGLLAQNWNQKSDFPGSPRMQGIAFSIANNGYYGMGRGDAGFLQDIWKYTPQTDTWEQVASFPGVGRTGAAVAVINGKAYVGLGFANNTFYDDWYEYNPLSNTWTKKSSCINGGRSFCAYWGFDNVSGGAAFVMMGSKLNNESTSEKLKYVVSSDTWEEVSSTIPNPLAYPLYNTVSFKWNGKGYFTSGKNASTIYSSFIEFDPLASNGKYWKTKASNVDMGYNGTAFATGTKAYACYGDTRNVIVYDSVSNKTTKVVNPLGYSDPLIAPSSFVVNSVGYFLGGRLGTFGGYQNKVWSIGTTSASSNLEVAVLDCAVFPNPVTDFVQISINAETYQMISIQILDMTGNLILEHLGKVLPGTNSIDVDVNQLKSGSYIIGIQAGNQKSIKHIQIIR